MVVSMDETKEDSTEAVHPADDEKQRKCTDGHSYRMRRIGYEHMSFVRYTPDATFHPLQPDDIDEGGNIRKGVTRQIDSFIAKYHRNIRSHQSKDDKNSCQVQSFEEDG